MSILTFESLPGEPVKWKLGDADISELVSDYMIRPDQDGLPRIEITLRSPPDTALRGAAEVTTIAAGAPR